MLICAVLALVLYTSVEGGVVRPYEIMQPPSCTEMNYIADELVTTANYMINYEDGMLLNANGFQQNLTLTILGQRLPIKLNVQVPQGTMTSFNNLTRISDVIYCTTTNLQTLEGVFRFQNIQLDYDGVEVALGSWSVKGPLSYILQPVVHVVLTKGNADCRLKSLEVVSSGDINYRLTIGTSTWRNWLISKSLERATLDANSVLTAAVLPNIQFYLESFLKTIWCDSSDFSPK